MHGDQGDHDACSPQCQRTLATGLGQQFIQIERMLMQHGLPAAQAAEAAMGQLLGEIFNPHGPIFQANYNSAINDAYLVTFWLALATIFLALTLPGRPKIEKRAEEEALDAVQSGRSW